MKVKRWNAAWRAPTPSDAIAEKAMRQIKRIDGRHASDAKAPGTAMGKFFARLNRIERTAKQNQRDRDVQNLEQVTKSRPLKPPRKP